ncbi:MAG: tRNA (N(6)-L-threonylcarbamoyladenosine(37)-C(2))-methylthiotransferase MtaB [Clostridia bacterium]|nr:tRNA (N(6)-L-threonylcarbamoyladenosine(37)-C(2))-methylthiotransferase MtaB [Clostridia bacterium]
MKAVVFTLGCKVNECESDSILAKLESKGYTVSDKLEYADLYIVNTCAVTKEAEKKSRQTASRIKKFNPNAKIIYTGCASQMCPKAFLKKSENVLVTGTFGKDKIADIIDNDGENIFSETKEYENMFAPKSLRTRTFIKVQDGCDNFCSYCIIPYLRGRSRSRSCEEIKKEIIGKNEVVITGINLSDYNYNGINLTGLLNSLKDIENTRIRLGSLEVNIIDDEFLSACKNLKNFAPHFHLSLQSGSNEVLKKMNRHYGREDYIKACDKIRKYFPLCAITTDIIVGFPTETEENFLDTLSIVDRVKFADIHPFIYSPRSGTVAYKMQDLPPEIKKQRLNKLLIKKAECKNNFASMLNGHILTFLSEDKEGEYVVGYTENYLKVYVKNAETNKLYKVKIGEPFMEGAIAEIVKGD